MRKLGSDVEKIMIERFGKDTVIALATAEQEVPYVRNVNAYYEDGSFYIITYALTNKIKQIEENPNVAIAGDWFTAHGKGKNLGYFGKEENRIIAEKLKVVFAEWIDKTNDSSLHCRSILSNRSSRTCHAYLCRVRRYCIINLLCW